MQIQNLTDGKELHTEIIYFAPKHNSHTITTHYIHYLDIFNLKVYLCQTTASESLTVLRLKRLSSISCLKRHFMDGMTTA